MDKECPKHPGEECAEIIVRCDLQCFYDLIEENLQKTKEALDSVNNKEPE
jgi:hypothetical protein